MVCEFEVDPMMIFVYRAHLSATVQAQSLAKTHCVERPIANIEELEPYQSFTP